VRAARLRGADWALRRRLFAAYVALGLAVLAAAGAIGASMLAVRDAVRTRGDVIVPAQITAGDLLSSLVDQESGLRGFVVSGRRDQLVPYTSGREREARERTRLDTLLAGRPGLLAALSTVEARVDTWRHDYAEPALAAMASGGTPAVVRLDPTLGKGGFDAIRAAEGRLAADLASASRAARNDVWNNLRLLVGVLAAATAGLVIVLVGLARALRSWVTMPLGRLGADARAVASGELDRTVAVTGPPDIASVAADVESMRVQLLRELALVRSARETLAEQAEDLRRSNRDLEQFAYVASHDLQEPLRKVASFCQLLERRYGDTLDNRGRQYVDFAVDGAKRMQQLINDLLALSRVGRTTAAFVDFPLGDALERALLALAVPIADSGAEISVGELPVVHGDPSLLAQLLQNLIGNALKFAGDAPPRVRLSAEAEGEHWELACADNGIGIEPEYADKIFIIFQRLHGREAYEGTGIGLALCRRIVEFHGGRIWLDTRERAVADGRATPGATFRWTLPRVEASPAPTATLEPASIVPGTADTGGTT
jgi:signal transduction histidine kinase